MTPIIKFELNDGAVVVTSDSRRFIKAVTTGEIPDGKPAEINGVRYIVNKTSLFFVGFANGCPNDAR